ncbi:con-10 family general stress protein [Ancylobacter lacus]|uniref:general stress protein n=1 Tax=Ancylobacter lacus TaxID=2579970 RepID=UPI001BCB9CA6|nr:KGG domain-containing protein [Ancylobacter lacus]MBS7538398.1 stress-induced protein [Ancylobacter lacus]
MADNTQHRGGSGNVAEDRERASEAGRKGGQHAHGSHQQNQAGGDHRQQGGSGNPGNAANDPERVSEAGRKSGQH